MVQKFEGLTQTHINLRSCFVGANEQYVVSGSEGTLRAISDRTRSLVPTDGNIYVWDRSTGTLVKTLSGHGTRTVGVVASNPVNTNIFASASYNCTVRLWELK